jgi:hypothetical protein
MTAKNLMLLGALASIVAGATGFAWWQHRADEERIIQLNNNRFFQWSRGGGSGELLLNVKPNPELRHVVSSPPVPLAGSVVVVGKAGVTTPGAIVSVANRRTGKSVGAYADAEGGFSLTLSAEKGDDLEILAMPPPAIARGPEPIDASVAIDTGN